MIIERKYMVVKGEDSFEHPLIIQFNKELKAIDDSLSITSISYSGGKNGFNLIRNVGCSFKLKGNKKLIQTLKLHGWEEDGKEKGFAWQDGEENSYYRLKMKKDVIYTKWAIYKTDVGLNAITYLDDENFNHRAYPYINEESLPVLVNALGGYSSFSEEFDSENLVKIIEILEDEEPLTREEKYPKNSDKFYYGWIDTLGNTYACGFQSHNDCSYDICKEIFPDQYTYNPERKLEELGWVKISRPVPYCYETMDKQEVYFCWDKNMTKKQIDTLLDLGLQDTDAFKIAMHRSN